MDICEFAKDKLDVRFGNRIMKQIEDYVPVYVALGGKKNEALDVIFANKIIRKLEGNYEDYIKEELGLLQKKLNDAYGKGAFAETEYLINKLSKRLG